MLLTSELSKMLLVMKLKFTSVIRVIHRKWGKSSVYDRYNFAMFKQIRKWYTLNIICTYYVATDVCISKLKLSSIKSFWDTDALLKCTDRVF